MKTCSNRPLRHVFRIGWRITNLPASSATCLFSKDPAHVRHETPIGQTPLLIATSNRYSPKGGGTGNSRSAELHRAHERTRIGKLTHHSIKPSLGAEDHCAAAFSGYALLQGNEDPFLPFDWHNFKRYWNLALELADVRYRNPTKCVTYVSLMFYEGHSDHDIAAWIGDTMPTMKERYQGRILRGNLDM